ncbi:hypothetical protein KEM55_004151 [Ascosphaera atra]|nr:hypothetical protein KEM55_004151 [Ascosphaera atra]
MSNPASRKTKPTTFEAAKAHLQEVARHPDSLQCSSRVLDDLYVELNKNTDPDVRLELVKLISELLFVYQGDTAPIIRLSRRVIEELSFDDIYSSELKIDFNAGLGSPVSDITILTLELLRKASASRQNIERFCADYPDLLFEVIKLFLSNEVIGVGQEALKLLEDFIISDCSYNHGAPSGFCRALFDNREIYRYIYETCSLKHGEDRSVRAKSIAQGRLIDLLAKLATVNWELFSTSHIPDIENEFSCQSLLDFAVNHMVDHEDYLIELAYLQFLSYLLTSQSPLKYSEKDSASLLFLKSCGVHQKMLKNYLDSLNPDWELPSFLRKPVQQYVAEYARGYPQDFLSQPDDELSHLLERLQRGLQIPTVAWAHGPVPSGDLNILASLPRVLLLKHEKLLNTIPSDPLNDEALDMLAYVFHGPEPRKKHAQEMAEDEPSASFKKEAAAARVLYLRYVNNHPDLWKRVAEAINAPVMRQRAVSAVQFVHAMLQTNWHSCSGDKGRNGIDAAIPSDSEVAQMLGVPANTSFPSSGLWALVEPSIITLVLPQLLNPCPPSSAPSHRLEDSGWAIERTKIDVIKRLTMQVREEVNKGHSELEDLLAQLEQWRRPGNVPLRPVTTAEVSTMGA